MTSPYLELEPRSESQVRTEAEVLEAAVGWRKYLWRVLRDEEQRLDQLETICIRLRDGDRKAGKELAAKAIWSPG